LAQVQKTRILRKPEVALVVAGDGMHFSAMRSVDRNKPAVLNVDKSTASERPDAPAIILKERLRRIIRLSASFADSRHLSVIPPVQTVATGNPYAAIPRS